MANSIENKNANTSTTAVDKPITVDKCIKNTNLRIFFSLLLDIYTDNESTTLLSEKILNELNELNESKELNDAKIDNMRNNINNWIGLNATIPQNENATLLKAINFANEVYSINLTKDSFNKATAEFLQLMLPLIEESKKRKTNFPQTTVQPIAAHQSLNKFDLKEGCYLVFGEVNPKDSNSSRSIYRFLLEIKRDNPSSDILSAKAFTDDSESDDYIGNLKIREKNGHCAIVGTLSKEASNREIYLSLFYQYSETINKIHETKDHFVGIIVASCIDNNCIQALPIVGTHISDNLDAGKNIYACGEINDLSAAFATKSNATSSLNLEQQNKIKKMLETLINRENLLTVHHQFIKFLEPEKGTTDCLPYIPIKLLPNLVKHAEERLILTDVCKFNNNQLAGNYFLYLKWSKSHAVDQNKNGNIFRLSLTITASSNNAHLTARVYNNQSKSEYEGYALNTEYGISIFMEGLSENKGLTAPKPHDAIIIYCLENDKAIRIRMIENNDENLILPLILFAIDGYKEPRASCGVLIKTQELKQQNMGESWFDENTLPPEHKDVVLRFTKNLLDESGSLAIKKQTSSE